MLSQEMFLVQPIKCVSKTEFQCLLSETPESANIFQHYATAKRGNRDNTTQLAASKQLEKVRHTTYKKLNQPLSSSSLKYIHGGSFFLQPVFPLHASFQTVRSPLPNEDVPQYHPFNIIILHPRTCQHPRRAVQNVVLQRWDMGFQVLTSNYVTGLN